MSDLSDRSLVFAASQRDAVATCKLLASAGLQCDTVKNLESLTSEIQKGAGVVLIAKETLNVESIEVLRRTLATQPKWSFLPLILLAANGEMAKGSSLVELLRPLRNLTLIERPVRVSTLISVTKAALADRQRQYELRDLLAELEISKVNAEAASQAKSSFLANMSHEIRTPLGIILGFSDFLADSELNQTERNVYALTVRRNGELLSALIDDVLDLAKVESGHMTVEKTTVVTREILGEILATMFPKASAKNVGITLNVGPDVPFLIETDNLRLKQILINMIGNAIKFTTVGSVQISVNYVAGKLSVVVSDSGIGISPEQSSRLFSAFHQADNSITRRFGGTGLGLVLSKQIAQALGGDLLLKKSILGKGSEFELVLDCGQSVSQPGSLNTQYENRTSLKGKRILIVDDSKDNQVLLARILQKSEIEVETADDGQQALDVLADREFDVVIMDVQMPRLGGYDAVSILRSNGYKRPIVALTAHAFKEDRDRAFEVGCNDYLTKPINKKNLMDVLSSMVLLSTN